MNRTQSLHPELFRQKLSWHAFAHESVNSLPGIEDIVVADAGIVIKPSVVAYAEGLRRMMSDPVLCADMGNRAHLHCAESFKRGKFLDQWESLLESVVK